MEQKSKSKKEDSFVIQIWGNYTFKLYPGSKSTKPYVHFQFVNPDTGKDERVRKFSSLKPGASHKDLKRKAGEVVSDLIDLLAGGWNPINNTFNDLPISPLSSIRDCIGYWLKQRAVQVDNNAIKPKALKMNTYLMDYFTSWLTAKGYLHRMPNTFTKIDVDAFLQLTANTRKWGKVSYNVYRTDLGTFFNYLLTLKIISENPVAGSVKKNTKKDSSRFKIYDESELKDVVQKLGSDKAYLGLYIASKMVFKQNIRPVELTRIKVKDLDFGKRTLRLAPENTKNGDEAIFNLDEELFLLLDELVVNKPADYFIFGHRCKPSALQIHQDYFGQKWRMFRLKYDVSDRLKFYALKHSSNYWDLKDGASFEEIRQRNRHGNLQVTTLYIRERLKTDTINASSNKRF